MDAGTATGQGLLSLGSANRARQARRQTSPDDETEENSTRIAHTLAACTRCRQRKTKCDPNLPKCLPCERSNQVCEYWDPAKQRKVDRSYVVKLQERVRALEHELGKFTEDDLAVPSTEDAIRQGGLVRNAEFDETPRFLGPSSGIAMTRLVMEEAKRYTDTRSIRELVPEIVTRRRTPVSPSVDISEPQRSYPMTSAVAATGLPNRPVKETLLNIFNQKAQYMFPTIHEGTLTQLVEDVYGGDLDPYKNYILRMMLAISIQKMDTQYAGLADSYYLAAMQYVEAVVRPMDLNTIQCLILIAQYSLLTPTRSPIYHIIGLATRLCLQLGLTTEKTIMFAPPGEEFNAIEQDMRRRMVWCVFNMELGLAHSLGRPSAFAIREDEFDVKFFAMVDDRYITPNGITTTTFSEKKIMCVHFFKMRLLQAEIRRVLYQTKRPEPQSEEHEWFLQMKEKMDRWLEESPSKPIWSKSWFLSKYNTIVVFLYRPSPQVPQPSLRAAKLCYDASVENIQSQNQHMKSASFDKTWVFLQSVYMAVNTVLWSISYPAVRDIHKKEEVREHIDTALSIITRCAERWPGTAAAADLYMRLSIALLRSYDTSPRPDTHSYNSESSPPAPIDEPSPLPSQHMEPAPTYAPVPAEQIPQFGPVFGQASDDNTAAIYYSSQAQPNRPTFRSSSIWLNPSSVQVDRRTSQYAPAVGPQRPLPNTWSSNSSSLEQAKMANHQSAHAQSVVSSSVSPEIQLRSPPVPLMSYTGNLNFDPNAHFMQDPSLSYQHLYAEQNYRIPQDEALNEQQYHELFEQLQMTGMEGIEGYFGISVPQLQQQQTAYYSAAG